MKNIKNQYAATTPTMRRGVSSPQAYEDLGYTSTVSKLVHTLSFPLFLFHYKDSIEKELVRRKNFK